MVVKEYENAQIFLDDYEAVMLEREAVSQLILYNAYKNLTSVANEKCMFGAVLDDEEVCLLFCNVAPYNLVIYVADLQMDRDKIATATVALADFILNINISIKGINARYDVCQDFIERYRDRANVNFLQNLGMDIMEIRAVNDIKPVEGNHRLARQEEAKLIADWMIQYYFETLASEMDYEAALNKVTNLISEDRIFIYENNEQKVASMAVATRKLLHGMAFSYAYTPEEFRGKGYAAANIYYMSKHFLENGYEFCTLFVDKRNPISNRAYEKVGFRSIEDNYDYKMILIEE